jgi:hypothetical protein
VLRRVLILGSTAAILVALPSMAGAAKVKNTHDTGPGSLRHALDTASAGHKVKVPAGHYQLTSGPLDIGVPLTVAGAGARKTIIDANGDSRVINAGPGTLKLSGVTVREGQSDAGIDGGGIASDGKVILSKDAILDNTAGSAANEGSGGGVQATTLTIRSSLFAGNRGYNGGAVAAGSILAKDSTFAGNIAGSQQANGDGGAFDDPVTLIDSTVTGNLCFNGDGCGAGIDDGGLITGSIVAGNTAYTYMSGAPGSPGNPGVPDDCGGAAPLGTGFNLSRDMDCAFESPMGRLGLAKLKDNGGPTDTVAISKKSVAFNGSTKHCTSRDQRGVRRPQGKRCDIGAYERTP